MDYDSSEMLNEEDFMRNRYSLGNLHNWEI